MDHNNNKMMIIYHKINHHDFIPRVDQSSPDGRFLINAISSDAYSDDICSANKKFREHSPTQKKKNENNAYIRWNHFTHLCYDNMHM